MKKFTLFNEQEKFECWVVLNSIKFWKIFMREI